MIVTIPSSHVILDTFDSLDFNKIGKLHVGELEDAVHTIWPTYQHKSAIMRAYKVSDINQDGFIGRNEFELFLRFLAFYNNLWCRGASNQQQLYKNQVMETASRLNITNMEQVFHDIDVDNKGFVLYDEFCTWMAKHSLGAETKSTATGGCFRFAHASATRAFLETRKAALQNTHDQVTFLTRLVLDFKCSVDFLNGKATHAQVEQWAILVHDCMSNVKRASLMNLGSVFEITHGADPIQMLAIYFSHTVSFEMDGVNHACRRVLDVIQDVMEQLKDSNRATKQDNDENVEMVMTVFGIEPGQESCLDPHVLDKFLSAIVAVRVLKDSLSLNQLVKVVACIEATIPFSCGVGICTICVEKHSHKHDKKRPRLVYTTVKSDATTRSLDKLYQQMQKANDKFQLGLSQHKLIKSIQRAADVVNRFRGVFAKDTDSYLQKIWGLLPHFNPALQSPKLYTVGDYHMAVKHLQQIVCAQDDGDDFFVEFKGVPDAQELSSFRKRYQANQQVGQLYIKCKTVSTAIVSAFAELTGGDVPFCFLVGDPGSEDTAASSQTMGRGLPRISQDQLTKSPNQKEMYKILSNMDHNTTRAEFDVTNWTVTAFVYGVLGNDGIERALPFTAFPMTHSSSRALLSSLPLKVVVPVGKEIGRIAVSRTDKVNDLLESFANSKTDKEP